MSDFNTLSAAFLASFKFQPSAFFHNDIEITDLRSRGEGRGILATADIPAETDLFIIPRDYVISVENSELSRKLPEIFDGVDEIIEDAEDAMVELPKPWLDLILVMVYEYFHREQSKWQAYWDVLPEAFDTLMFWSDDELAELQASAARAKIGKDDADRMFRRKILPVIAQYESVFYPDGGERLAEEDLLRLAHRMGSLIMAYAFDLENDNGEDEEENEEDGWTEDKDGKMAMGMVPMADMLNADAEFNAHLEHGDTELTMKSLREIKKGEEVLNYYGPLPNSDLLRRYGYTSTKHARFDVVEIGWGLVKKASEEVLGQLPNIEVDEEDLEESFLLERDSGDPDESGLHRTEASFTTLPEELVDQVTMFASAALHIEDTPTNAQKQMLKQSFLQVMARALPARLMEYATSAEQDEDLLKLEAIPTRTRMAINVRLGEKRLLKEAQQVVDLLLEKHSDVTENGTTSERPTKKQKVRR